MSLKSRSISSMFHRTLLDAQLSSPCCSPFPTRSPSPMTSSASPSTATLQGGMLLGRLAEQSLLTSYEPKTFIEVSSEHTPINLLSRLRILWMRLKCSTQQTWDGWLHHCFLWSAKKVLSHSVIATWYICVVQGKYVRHAVGKKTRTPWTDINDNRGPTTIATRKECCTYSNER